MDSKKLLFAAVFILSLFVTFSGCVTQGVQQKSKNPEKNPMIFSNDVLDARLELLTSRSVRLALTNKTNKVITLVMDSAVFTDREGGNCKLVTGDTLVIDAERSHPVQVIPPKSKYVKEFYSNQTGSYRGSWSNNNLTDSSFVFCYRIDKTEDFMFFSGNDVYLSLVDNDDKIGTIVIKKKIWNFFFRKSVDERREYLFNLAEARAKKLYGERVKLANVVYRGNWNILSLVYLGSSIGGVESARITADVVEDY